MANEWTKVSFSNLPKSMAERALWARNAFIQNPQESEVDDDTLVWCFNKEDNLWYSIVGNYSQYSPTQKRLKEAQRQIEYENRLKNAEELAMDYYQQVLYQSEIRKLVLERDNFTCQKCQKTADTKFHIHHVLKRIETGSDHLDNLVTVCPSCHRKADTSEYNPKWK